MFNTIALAGRSTEHIRSLALAVMVPRGVVTSRPKSYIADCSQVTVFKEHNKAVLPRDESRFISLMRGFRKVVMVGFVSLYHNPARRRFFFWNLHKLVRFRGSIIIIILYMYT